jgi:hypothetical protein
LNTGLDGETTGTGEGRKEEGKKERKLHTKVTGSCKEAKEM